MFSRYQDPYNDHRTRTTKNMDYDAYNCGGFALNTFTWVLPFYRREDEDYLSYTNWTEDELDNCPVCDWTEERRIALMEQMLKHCSMEETRHRILQHDIECLLHKYPFLKQIKPQEISPKNRLIAYRLYINYNEDDKIITTQDFHFKVREKGVWYEKMGSYPIKRCKLRSTEAWDYDTLCYDGEIIYFFDTRKWKGNQQRDCLVSRFGNYRIQ